LLLLLLLLLKLLLLPVHRIVHETGQNEDFSLKSGHFSERTATFLCVFSSFRA
jgi:hypothetical protein